MIYYKKTLTLLVAFTLGIIISIAGIMIVFSKYEFFGFILVPVWAFILYAGTKSLPEAITLPYDPVGHPALHYVGITLNSVYIAIILLFVFTVLKQKYLKTHENK